MNKPKMSSIFDLAIIGAGPAGISMACEAVKAGIAPEKIVIIEKAQKHSWSIRKFYPDDKLVTANYKGNEAICTGVLCLKDSSKAETLSYLDRAIAENNLNVFYQETVTKILKKSNGQFLIEGTLDSYLAKTCVIAIGIFGQPNRPEYKIPEQLESKVFFDVNSENFEDKRVLVVGGGDSASEYAQFLVQKKADVTISYRKSSFSRMNEINFNSLHSLRDDGKIKVMLNSNVKALEWASDVKAIKVYFKSGEDLIVDHIVYALGGTSPKKFLKSIGIELSAEGIEVDANLESKVSGLFLIGDLTAGRGGGSINLAFNSAHTVMEEFCKFHLDCKL